MINLTGVLADAVPTTTTMMLTLLLSENTSIAFAGLLLLVPLVLVIAFPIFLLSMPGTSWKAKLLALGLAGLPIWLGRGMSDELGWQVDLVIYLPMATALVNLARSASKEEQDKP